ncbi:MAG: hypothetical protein AAF927_09415 [Bacteroidota bacterium]
MRASFCCTIFLLGTFSVSLSQNAHSPMFFDLGGDNRSALPITIGRQEKICSWSGEDTSILHQLELCSDSLSKPLYYFAYINTPVCIDGSCKPLFVNVYWDLLGNYVGYGVIEAELLTKYDHELFTSEDYQKLHWLLLNKHSILARKKLSDLFDTKPAKVEKVTFNGVELDAVSGATKREIGQSVVKGALYSCYTLWHLVHGPIADSMHNRIKAVYSPSDFLYADYPPYQYYALKQMDSLALKQEWTRVHEIFLAASPLQRTYLLKKMPDHWFAEESLGMSLFESFADLDIQSQTLLLQHLAYTPPELIESLADYIPAMTRNQLKLYLKALELEPISTALKEKLQVIIDSQSYTYSYLLEDFLAER